MAYGYYKTITIDYTKVVGSANLTNFPAWISIASDNDLRTAANGGHVQNSSGYDLIFSSTDSLDGSGKLDFEIERYVSTTGELRAWVEIPTLSYTANTVIYLLYGDSGVTTSQQNKTGTWDSGFVGVYHLNETSGDLGDSTTNANVLASTGSPTMAGAGQLYSGSAVNFDGTNDAFSRQYLFSTVPSEVTIEFLAKPDAFGLKLPVYHGDNGEIFTRFDDTTKLLFYANQSGTGKSTEMGSLSTGTWYHCFCTYKQNGYVKLRVNKSAATSVATDNTALTDAGVTYLFTIGAYDNSSQWFDGLIDEVRVSSVERSAGWGDTSYNSMMSPSTFYSISAEGGGGGEPPVAQLAKVNGIALAAIAKYQGIAKASISKVNGLTIQ